MTQLKLRFLGILALVVILGCAGGQIMNPWSDMTHKQRAAWMNGIYNSQYDDYLAAVAKPDLTEEERDILRNKKKRLTELWPLLKDYSHYAGTGQVPPETIEAQVIRLINELTPK